MINKKNKKFICILLAVISSIIIFDISHALAADYYVSTNGSNSNNGSINSPWSTLDYAVKHTSPGDTIYMRTGTYAGMGDIGYNDRPEGGAPGQIKTIRNYPGEDVYITSNIKIYAGWMHVIGLHFTGGSALILGSGINDYADMKSEFQAINNTFSGTPGYECIASHGNDVLIEGNVCDIQGNSKGTQGHGVYISVGENITVRNNVFKGMTGYGIHVFDQRRSGDAASFNRLIKNVVIENNVISNSEQRSGIIVAGYSEDGVRIEDVTIRNNIIFNNPDDGIIIKAPSKNVYIYNNIIYKNANSINFDSGYHSGTINNVVIKNNILDSPSGNQINNDGNSTVAANNNLYWPSAKFSSSISDSNPIIGDPKYINSSALDFHYQSNSAAIDKGLTLTEVPKDKDGNLRPMDGNNDETAQYDIGAYEYTGTYIPPAPDTQAPTVPTGLTATATSATQINLTWNASTDNVGVAGYRIYRNGSQVGTSTTTSYSDTGLTPSTTYTYKVEAYDAAGNTALSASVSATTPAAPDTQAPSVSIASPASGSTVSGTINVSASASDNVGVAGVQFKLDGSNLGSEDTSSPYSVSWDTTTAANGSHTLTATARDAAGNTTTSSAITITVNNDSSDTQSPTVPTGLTATAASATQINLSWNASTDNVAVTGYNILRNGSRVANSTSTSYSDTGLTPSTTYTYTVEAYDAAGNTSAASTAASATTLNASADITPPSPPANLKIIQ